MKEFSLTIPKRALWAKPDFTNSPNLKMGQTYLLAEQNLWMQIIF